MVQENYKSIVKLDYDGFLENITKYDYETLQRNLYENKKTYLCYKKRNLLGK